MNEVTHPPSGYAIQSALSAWQSARMRLLAEDPSLEDDEAALIELLGPEQAEIEDLLARLIRGVLHSESMADAAKARASLLRARAQRYENRAQTMRATAFSIMDQNGLMRLETDEATASIRQGSPSVEITDEDLLPDAFVEVETIRKVDKRTLLAALKSGANVAGCVLTNSHPTLMVRTR